eukprot:Colp12_sorted_trinity150504_noHs@3153
MSLVCADESLLHEEKLNVPGADAGTIPLADGPLRLLWAGEDDKGLATGPAALVGADGDRVRSHVETVKELHNIIHGRRERQTARADSDTRSSAGGVPARRRPVGSHGRVLVANSSHHVNTGHADHLDVPAAHVLAVPRHGSSRVLSTHKLNKSITRRPPLVVVHDVNAVGGDAEAGKEVLNVCLCGTEGQTLKLHGSELVLTDHDTSVDMGIIPVAITIPLPLSRPVHIPTVSHRSNPIVMVSVVSVAIIATTTATIHSRAKNVLHLTHVRAEKLHITRAEMSFVLGHGHLNLCTVGKDHEGLTRVTPVATWNHRDLLLSHGNRLEKLDDLRGSRREGQATHANDGIDARGSDLNRPSANQPTILGHGFRRNLRVDKGNKRLPS